jgi:hypothetical protein
MRREADRRRYLEEATTNRFLSWLAWNMKKHGRSVFLIEDLQPSWLVPSSASYFRLADALLGFAIGLIAAPIAVVTETLLSAAAPPATPATVLTALAAGTVLGAITSGFSFRRHRFGTLHHSAEPGAEEAVVVQSGPDRREAPEALPKKKGWGCLSWLGCLPALSWVGLLVGGVLWAVAQVLSREFATSVGLGRLLAVLFATLLFVLYRMLERAEVGATGPFIRTVETLGWSPRHGLKTGLLALLVGLAITFVAARLLDGWLGNRGAFGVRSLGRTFDVTGDESVGRFLFTLSAQGQALFLVLWAAAVASGVTLGGIRPRVVDLKTRPNQGMVLSIRNAFFSFFTVSVPVGTVLAVLFVLLPAAGPDRSPTSTLILAGLTLGGTAGGAGFLLFGGMAVLRHFLLRFLLALRRRAPLDYAGFLDFAAAELGFLQKVGGGYVFLHRYLLEHFAAMSAETGLLEPQRQRNAGGKMEDLPILAGDSRHALASAEAAIAGGDHSALRELVASGSVWVQSPARFRVLDYGESTTELMLESTRYRGRRAFIRNRHLRPDDWLFEPDPVASDEDRAAALRWRAGVRCPRCGWIPKPVHQWACESCGHTWDTFETRGICPSCRHKETSTQCMACEAYSPHEEWYETAAASLRQAT